MTTFAVQWALDTLTAARDDLARVLDGCMAPLPDDQLEAVQDAERQVADCALALEHAKQQARTLIAARNMTQMIYEGVA